MGLTDSMIKQKIKNIYSFRYALWNMATKKLKAKYKGSILGIAWALVSPLLLMVVITFVFTVVFKTEIKNFHLFVLSGIFPWVFFSSASTEAISAILGQRSIIRQFNIPIEILPLSSVLSNFFNFLIGWVIIYPVFILVNLQVIPLSLLLFLTVFINLIFVCGIGLIFSALNVFFRDLEHLSGVLFMFWFWVTPVFYSLNMVPDSFRWICMLNPMTYFVEIYRSILFAAKPPDLFMFSLVSIIAFATLLIGYYIFIRLEKYFIKKI
jgi:lipopolysaccharide transport system permease protein